MYTVIVILHVIVSITLILIILLQTGKGTDIGAVFGGGSSQTLFGSTGPTSFLGKLTAGAAIVFMLTSLFLAYFAGGRSSPTIMKGGAPQSMPGPAASQGPPPLMPPGPNGSRPVPAGPPIAPGPAQPGR
ncbi:MAG TPA: preprotein translocase subunit SecG [Candidatus Deferrimicrobiaceae bacterium]|nr:preprotein translocase subunit SecG [Candidatus Deferrimicrobiaceae bacterium]